MTNRETEMMVNHIVKEVRKALEPYVIEWFDSSREKMEEDIKQLKQELVKKYTDDILSK